jgi:hypothetical protein
VLVLESALELFMDLMWIVDVVECERFDVTELVQSVSMVEGVMVVLDPHVVEVIVRVVANSVDVLVLVTGE